MQRFIPLYLYIKVEPGLPAAIIREYDEPWLTIEMNGDKLIQIHGYRNEGIHTMEGRFAPDPREVYREFLDTWLDWLKKGSKRDKQGRPKLPGKKRKAA